MRTTYNHKTQDKKWQEYWEKEKVYRPNLHNPTKPFYNLMMFPYLSAEGLHVGNMYAFTGADVYGRYQRMKGNDVFEPIGLDGFGIHSENYAIKINKNPKKQAEISQKRFYAQLRRIGNGFDWEHTLETYNPNYYKWTQWLFIQMYKKGLAYRGKAMVNWCPSCKTVLADEQVEAGLCERCKSETTRKKTEQWFFKITKYADRLLDNIEKIDWPEKIKIAQRQWIGKKMGTNIIYPVKGTTKKIVCFTTRPNTNFGATFIALSPEYAKKMISCIPNKHKKEVKQYIDISLKKTEQQRLKEARKKSGVFTGLYAINQLNGYEMPIYIADFVLQDVGTGAVVGVPGHDMRDFEFAKEFNIEVKRVVVKDSSISRSYLMGGESINDKELEEIGITIHETTKQGHRKLEIPNKALDAYKDIIRKKLKKGYWNDVIGKKAWYYFKEKDGKAHECILDEDNKEEIAQLCSKLNKDPIEKTRNIWLYIASNEWYQEVIVQEDEGIMVNSEFLNGLDVHEATEKMMGYLEEKGWGKRLYHYHLRDWLISRQRYWGPPIPMVFCKKCGWKPVDEKNLPVKLPDLSDWKPTKDGKAPLERAEKTWLFTACPECGGQAQRETNVTDVFLDSTWYFLRYPSIHAKDAENRIFNKRITKTWMPVNAYIGGAEHAVLHLLYSRFVWMCLYDWGYFDFSSKGLPISGWEEPFPFLFSHGLIIKDGSKMSKSRGNVVVPDEYIDIYGADTLRMYLMFLGPYDQGGDFRDSGIAGMRRFLDRVWALFTSKEKVGEKTTKNLKKKLHKTVRDISNDLPSFKYNTAIARFMEFVNIWKQKGEVIGEQDAKVALKLIAPLAPHITEELWHIFGERKSIHTQSWPEYDKELVKDDKITIVVQVNGKIRATLNIKTHISNVKAEVLKLAKENEIIKKHLKGKTIGKEIFVPERLVNFVTS